MIFVISNLLILSCIPLRVAQLGSDPQYFRYSTHRDADEDYTVADPYHFYLDPDPGKKDSVPEKSLKIDKNANFSCITFL